MTGYQFDFRIERSWSRDGYNVWILSYENNQIHIAKPIEIEFQPHTDGHVFPEPTLKIDGVSGRMLLDATKRALSNVSWFSKEELETHAKVEKAMKDHIDSLKLVIDRVIK